MAEAIVNTYQNQRWEAYSAGTHPVGFVHPKARQAINELGIQHKGMSKSVEQFRNHPFDVVITVCDSAVEECPLWLGSGTRIHLGYPDPAKATGSENEIMEAFRKVRDEMLHQLPDVLG
jgi:arsenate reductase